MVSAKQPYPVLSWECLGTPGVFHLVEQHVHYSDRKNGQPVAFCGVKVGDRHAFSKRPDGWYCRYCVRLEGLELGSEGDSDVTITVPLEIVSELNEAARIAKKTFSQYILASALLRARGQKKWLQKQEQGRKQPPYPPLPDS